MKLAALAVLFASGMAMTTLQPAAPPPGTDIFLASLTAKASQLTVGTPTNLTKSCVSQLR